MADWTDIGAWIAAGAHPTERMRDAIAFRRTYEGALMEFLRPREGTTKAEWDSQPKVTLNVTRPVVDLLSGLYWEQPLREWPDVDRRLADRLAEVYRRLRGPTFVAWDRYTRLHGAALLGVSYRDGRIRLTLLSGDVVEVWPVPGRPEEPQYLAILDGDTVQVWSSPEYADGRIREYRRGQDRWELVADSEVPYRTLPFVAAHNTVPHTSFWTPGLGPSLCPLNWHINQLLTDHAYALSVQHYGQWVAKGIAGAVEIGPGRIVELDEGGEISILAPSVATEQVMRYVDWLLNQTLASHGVPLSVYRLEQSAARSGVSIVAEQLPLIMERRLRGRLFEAYERRLAWVIAVLLEAHEGLPAPERPDDMPVRLQWLDPQLPVQDSEWVSRKTWELDRGLTSPVDVFMELHPGVTKEEARERLAEVRQDRIKLAPLGGME